MIRITSAGLSKGPLTVQSHGVRVPITSVPVSNCRTRLGSGFIHSLDIDVSPNDRRSQRKSIEYQGRTTNRST